MACLALIALGLAACGGPAAAFAQSRGASDEERASREALARDLGLREDELPQRPQLPQLPGMQPQQGAQPPMPAFLSDPAVRRSAERMLSLMQDPRFQRAAQAVTQSPRLKWFFLAAAVAIVVLMILRYRILTAIPRWWARLFVRVLFLGLFAATVAGIGILFFGQPLVVLLTLVWKAVS